jgi:hypothetical protein
MNMEENGFVGEIKTYSAPLMPFEKDFRILWLLGKQGGEIQQDNPLA